MTLRLILSALLFSAAVLATETSESMTPQIIVTESSAYPSDEVINAAAANSQLLYFSSKILYVKNPCMGMKGYRFSRVRGFGFERGHVKKFQSNGILSYEKIQYSSLGEFFNKRGLCQPITKAYPALNNIGPASLEIWP